jgi:hypothetical protein
LLLAFTVLSLILHMYLGTPLSGLGIVFLWFIYSAYILFQADIKQAFAGGGVPAKDVAQEIAE